ncbi:MAG: NAD(P)H-dependent oxidoreductase subunit E [Solirubrobacterales bacterium]
MTPIIPGDRAPWRGDPGHIQDVPEPPWEDQIPEEIQGEPLADASITAEQAAAEQREPHGEPAPVRDPSEVEVPEELAAEIRRTMARYPQKRSAAIPALWAVQRRYGWCSPEGIDQAAAVMGVTPGHLQSVASFYDLFHLEPTAEHQVLVCTNISCWLRGSDDLLEAFLDASRDDDAYVRGFECLGACDIAPMASIDDRYYGPLTDEDAAAVIHQLRAGEEVLPEKRLAARGAAGGEADDDERLRDHPLNRPDAGGRAPGGDG